MMNAVCSGRNIVESELLLIHRRWSKQRRLYPTPEPFGSRIVRIANLRNALALQFASRLIAIAKGYETVNLLAVGNIIRAAHLVVCKRNPASVQPKRLSQQNKMLAVISDEFLSVVGLVANHRKIVRNTPEIAVSHPSAERLRLIHYKLNMKSALVVYLGNFILQNIKIV